MPDLSPIARPMPHLLVVVVPSFALAAVAAALDLPLPIRGPLVAWAVLGVPALVLGTRLGARWGLERWVLGLAGAAAVTIIVSQGLLYAGVWSAEGFLGVMALLSVAGAGRHRMAAPSLERNTT